MNIEDFKNYLESNKIVFEKWGAFVSEKIKTLLTNNIENDIDTFIKLPVVPRIKETKSALGKIARKNYADPINQMTDIVGIRFVVLLSDDIETVCKIIEDESCWNASVSKDIQDEIEKNPKIFDYQSQHYEIRPKDDFEFDGILINKNICCEVQIRTLLQHAYAEIVHDSIYKPIVGKIPKKTERQIAKSMALMETTDELFSNAMKLLNDSNKPRNKVLDDLIIIYENHIGIEFIKIDKNANYTLLDEFKNEISANLIIQINSLINNKKFIIKKIQDRASSRYLFAQPVVFFSYWLVENMDKYDLEKRWSLPGCRDDLEVIFSDLGG